MGTGDRTGFDPSLAEQLESAQDGSRTRQAGLLLLALAGVLLLVSHAMRRPFHQTGASEQRYLTYSTIAVALVAVYTLTSAAWADEPALSLRRWVAMLLLAIAAVGVGRGFTRIGFIRLLCVAMLIQATGGVFQEWSAGVLHPFDPDYRFSGGLHPNSQAVVCVLLMSTALVIRRQSERRIEWLLMSAVTAMGFVLLLLTRSRTTVGAMLLAVAILWLLSRPMRFLRVIVVCTSVAVGGTFALSSTMREALISAALLGRDTATDRTPIWESCLDYFTERPFIGYGYNAFWDEGRVEAIGRTERWGVGEAHSSYLEILLDGGVFGAVLMGLMFAAFWRAAWGEWWRTNSIFDAFAVLMLLYAGFHGILESSGVRPGLFSFVLLVTIVQVFRAREAFTRQALFHVPRAVSAA
jgi:O-antigen ligase